MSDIITRLGEAIGPQNVITDATTLDKQRHDYWVVSHLRDYLSQQSEHALCIVRPRETKDVQAILKLANETRTPVMPYGLGSGVCGGVLANARAILLDMGAMNRVVDIDETNLLATFEAGKNGLEAEEAVAAKGLTIGHWPQSIGVSSVGGWVATRASGQFSTAYGNIENIIYAIEAVLPNGDVVNIGISPRAASGPDLRHIFLGSEGTMGVITKVTFSLRRQAPKQAYSAFYTRTMAGGIEAQRQMIQAGYTPPVMRQYDNAEVRRNFAETVRDEDGLLIMVHEGPTAMVATEKAAIAEIAKKAGLDEAPEAAVTKWLSNRNHVPSWESLFEQNVVAETIEVAASWTKIVDVYDQVVASLNEVPGIVNASAHSSHVYRSGINLYFTFAVYLEDKEALEAAYFDCADRVLKATAVNGGTISHHHGIGRARRDYLVNDLGEGGVALLQMIKRAIDPHHIMNAEVLIPDMNTEQASSQ